MLGTPREQYNWYYNINQVREFDVSKNDAANNTYIFFERNIRENVLNIVQNGGYYSQSFPIKDIVLGKEYVIGGSPDLCFKVEKIR